MYDELVEKDGENRAVRGLILGLDAGRRTFSTMRDHMRFYGMPFWPDEFIAREGHITKFDLQIWFRYLFELEKHDNPETVARSKS